jgi:type IV secretion system protein VirD4
MSRSLKLSLVGVGAVVGVAAIGALWSFDYALAYFVTFRRWDMLNALVKNHDWFLPAEQVWTNFGRAELSRVVNLSLVALMLEVAAVGGAIAYCATEWRRSLGPIDGARFAARRDLRKAKLLQGAPGESILLGRFEGKDVRYSGDSHLLVNGPTRSGKGRGFVMPNLLQWLGSAIVLDIKLENYLLTGATRAAMGQQIIVIAPGSEFSHCWNPLDFVRPWPARATDVMNMAAALIEEPERGEKFWALTARGLLAGLIAYVLESRAMEGRRTMRSVQRLLSTEDGLAKTLQARLEIEPNLSSFVVESFRGFINGEEKQRKSFEKTVDTGLQAWKNKLIGDMTAKSDFDIRDFRRKGMSVFIASPVSDFGTVEPLIRLFIQQIHDLALRELPRPDEKLKVLLMLDEFYQFKRLPEVVLRAPLVGGYGFKIAVMSQNLPQIDERYSKVTREAFLGNMDIKLFIAANDDTTAEAISRDLGRKFVKRVAVSERLGFGGGNGVTRTSTWVETDLLSPANIKQLSDDKTLMLVRGHPGVILDKLNFYSDPVFQRSVKESAAFRSMLKTPAVEEVVEWPLFEAVPPDVQIPRGALRKEVSARERAWDKEDEAAWRQIRALAQRAFVEPVVFVHRLTGAMSAEESDEIASIAQTLRLRPETCGALRGKGLMRRLGDKGRKRALGATAELRSAIIAMRRRIHEERLRVAGSQAGAEPADAKVEQAAEVRALPPAAGPLSSEASQPKPLFQEAGMVVEGPRAAADETVAIAASEAAQIGVGLAAAVDKAVLSIADVGIQQRVAAMRDKMRSRVAAFASDADQADRIPVDLMPQR